MVDNARSNTEDDAWKNKVRSLDDSLKSLRSADKPKSAKRAKQQEKSGRGLFSFMHAKPPPIVAPIKPELNAE